MNINVTSVVGSPLVLRMENLFVERGMERIKAKWFDRTPHIRRVLKSQETSPSPEDRESAERLRKVLEQPPEGIVVDFAGGALPPLTVTITFPDGRVEKRIWDPSPLTGEAAIEHMDQFIAELINSLQADAAPRL